jgi:tetratricopeptide (TPR) repeat protein
LLIGSFVKSMSSAPAQEHLEAPAVALSQPFRSSAGRTALCCLLLTCAVLASYSRTARNGFLNYDDDRYIFHNPHVASGITWPAVKWAFTTYEQANWHPLTWLSHALDCGFFGLNPAAHHLANVLLHAANAVLLFLLLQSSTRLQWRSLMVAALFAVHPINVESVAWAAERKNTLSMLFFLLALYAYVLYARRPGFGRYMAVFGLFGLALLSKPQVIAFPFLLLLWDYWPLCRIRLDSTAAEPEESLRNPKGWQLILEKLPLFFLSLASALITMKAQAAGGAVKNFSEYGPLLRFETATISYVRYLADAFWPARLVALYPHPTGLYPAWQIGAATLLLVLITAIVVLRAREQRYLAVGWFWFLGSLVPMIGLVQVGLQARADRYAYIPFVGLFLMVTWLIADWVKALKTSSKWVVAAAVVCVAVLGTLTYRQVGYWHDSESFWQRTLALTKDNHVAENNLGEFLSSQGRIEEAAAHFRAAYAINPNGLTTNLNLGAYEDRRGNWPAAIEHYQMVADHAGDSGMRATALGSLGFVYRQTGQTIKAKQCFETAVQIDPARARARVGLGLLAEDNGDDSEAVHQFSLAAAVQPSEIVELLLAQALQRGGHADEAKAIYNGLAQSPNLPAAEKEVELLLVRK